MSSILNDLSDVLRKHDLLVDTVGTLEEHLGEEGIEAITREEMAQFIVEESKKYDRVYILYCHVKKRKPKAPGPPVCAVCGAAIQMEGPGASWYGPKDADSDAPYFCSDEHFKQWMQAWEAKGE